MNLLTIVGQVYLLLKEVAIMKQITEILNKLQIPQTEERPALTTKEHLIQLSKAYNERVGSLVGYDCPKCKNKGYISVVTDKYGYDEEIYQVCECVEHRRYLQQLRKSGLESAIKNYTFKNYIVKSHWQKDIKQMCIDYVKNSNTEWLFLGGQSGCGKTHLCTAVCGQYLKKGISVVYMMWREDSTTMKQAIVNNPQYYENKIEKYKSVDVLYIDDLFKSGKNKDGIVMVSPADINLAFDILNYRSFKGMKTIISSELTIDEMRAVDEAIAGRIFENSISKKYGASIAYDGNKNYRFTGDVNG